MIETILKYGVLTVLCLYTFGMSIYSAFTANENRPLNDSSDLFIASYVICIISSIIYIGLFFNILAFALFHNSDKTNDENKVKQYSSIYSPLLLNIYWIVINFNYKVSKKYDEYALVKTIEFFILLGLLFVNILCVITCLIMLKKQTGDFKNKLTSKDNVKTVMTSV